MLSPLATPRYRAAGFTFDSEIAFSKLLVDPAPGHGPADILFRIGEPPPMGEGLTMQRKTFGFTVVQGRRVVVSVSALARPGIVERTVLSSGLNAVAYQRGLLPLHASAVGVGETCWALCGAVGAGKSTIAAALAQAGYPLLCDDLVIVHPDRDSSGPLVWPAVTRSKLTRHSVDLLGGAITALTPFAEWDLKAVTEIGEMAAHTPRRLAGIYWLGWGEPALRHLSPLEAVTMLDRCLRKPRWLQQAGTAATIRQAWLDLVSRIPIVLATRRREPAAIAELSELLIDSWKQGSMSPNAV
jgi:hypothetical protein